MYILSTCYIYLICVSIYLCKNHYIIETKDEADQDEIKTDIIDIYNDVSSGDYSAFHDCKGKGIICKTKGKQSSNIVENSCIFT